jgi:hypothetical protein
MSPTSGVIGEAWGLYKAHWKHLVTISAAVYLGAALISLVLGILFENWIAGILAALISFIALFWLQAALVKAVDDIRDGRAELSLSDTLGAASPHIVPVTLAGILFGLAFGIGLAALILLAVALGAVGAVIGIVGIIGWFLLILVWWSLVTPAIVLENKGVGDGLSRSRQLVEGHGWSVLGTMALVFLVLVGVTLVLNAVLFPLNDAIQGFVSQVVSGTLAAPFVALVLTLLYFRLRAAKETPTTEPPPPAPA